MTFKAPISATRTLKNRDETSQLRSKRVPKRLEQAFVRGRQQSNHRQPTKVQATTPSIQREANRQLASLLNTGIQQLEKRVKQGDTRAITYLLDRVLPQQGEQLSIPLVTTNGLKTIDDVTNTAEQIATAFLDQSITKTEAEAALSILTKFTSLRLAQHMGDLEAKLAEVEHRAQLDGKSMGQSIDSIPASLLPKWGGIAAKMLDD